MHMKKYLALALLVAFITPLSAQSVFPDPDLYLTASERAKVATH
jgi:hypothetical protein